MKRVFLAAITTLALGGGCAQLVPFNADVAMRAPRAEDDVFGGIAFSGLDKGLRSTGIGLDYREIVPRLRELAFGPARERSTPPPFEATSVGHMTVELHSGMVTVFRPYELVHLHRERAVVICPGAFACEETPSVRRLCVALIDAGFDVLVYLPPLHGRALEIEGAGGRPRRNSLGLLEADELVALGNMLAESHGNPPGLVGLSLGGVYCALIEERERASFGKVVVVCALTGGLGPVFDVLRDHMDDSVQMPLWNGLGVRPARVAAAHMYGVALALTMRIADLEEDAMPTSECFDRYVNEHAAALLDGESPEDVATQARMLASLQHSDTSAVFFDHDLIAPPEFADAAENAGVTVVRMPGGHLAPSSWNAYEAAILEALGGR